jgi:6-phosphofructokinase 1
MLVGLLSGGGDSPAINAAIRAVVRKAHGYGHEILGIKNGWAGLIEGEFKKLSLAEVSGILPRGGTILGTSRTNPFKIKGGIERLLENASAVKLEALIAIGGDDTLGVAHRLNHLEKPLRCVGIPQTIDNDLNGTEFAIGFQSAVEVATDALDKLHTTAESHHRIMILEVMGRDAGHVALAAGLAGGADIILVPEYPFDFEEIIERIKKRRQLGKTFSLIIVAEGARPVGVEQIVITEKRDAFGHVRLGGVGEYLANEIEQRTGLETRSISLGHLQRGGVAAPFDRILATQFGIAAVELVEQGEFDRMVAYQCGKVTSIPLVEALAKIKPIDENLYKLAQLFY